MPRDSSAGLLRTGLGDRDELVGEEGRIQAPDCIRSAVEQVGVARLEGQLHRLDVPDEHPLAVCLLLEGSVWIELEPDDRVAALRERAGEVAARAADVEDVLARPDGVEQLRVRAMPPLVQRNVTG